VVEVRSADHPEYLVGDSLDWVIVSEAAKSNEETWKKYLRPALSDKRGIAIFPTTPEGSNWLYDLWGKGQDPDDQEWESWQFPSWENTVIYPEGERDPEIQALRREMSAEEFDQEIAAKFTAAKGRVYTNWDEQRNVVDGYRFNPEWQSYIAWDFGWSNETVSVEFQVDPWDNVWIWREYSTTYKTLDEHVAERWRTLANPAGYRLDLGFGDHADPEACKRLSRELRVCPTISAPEAKENWRDGVEVVRWLLTPVETGEVNEFGKPEMRPKLFVDRTCKGVIKEFNNYRAKPEPNTLTADVPDKPVKKNDHRMDAIRYGLMHVFRLGASVHMKDLRPELWVPRSRSSLIETDGVAAGAAMGMFSDGETMFTLAGPQEGRLPW
jgi:hypothetical protein